MSSKKTKNTNHTISNIADDYLPLLRISDLVSQAFLKLQASPEIISRENSTASFEEIQEAHRRVQRLLKEVGK